MLESDIETMLFCSFRYALGRRTYIVSDVVELLTDYESVLQERTKILIRKEIQEAIDTDRAGMNMDVLEWMKVLEVL